MRWLTERRARPLLCVAASRRREAVARVLAVRSAWLQEARRAAVLMAVGVGTAVVWGGGGRGARPVVRSCGRLGVNMFMTWSPLADSVLYCTHVCMCVYVNSGELTSVGEAPGEGRGRCHSVPRHVNYLPPRVIASSITLTHSHWVCLHCWLLHTWLLRDQCLRYRLPLLLMLLRLLLLVASSAACFH